MSLQMLGSKCSAIFMTHKQTTNMQTQSRGYLVISIHKENAKFQVCVFRKFMQEPGGHLDSYHTRLRILANNSEFANADSEIKTQTTQSCTSSGLHWKTLWEPELTLDDSLHHGTADGKTKRLTKHSNDGRHSEETKPCQPLQKLWR